MLDAIQNLLARVPYGPLNDYCVLEIGGNISGPMASEELARKGALVIKIEMPQKGDPARSYLSHPVFTSCNASKASIALDKNQPADQAIYLKLLQLANVIIDNRSPDAKARDSILQNFLKSPKLFPVIFSSIVGYDSQDYHDHPALDVAIQATSGMAMVNGAAPYAPLKVGFVVVDTVTGLQAASEIKDHLLSLAKGGSRYFEYWNEEEKVVYLEQSMAKTAALLMTGQYLNAHTQNKDAFREGNKDLWIAPFSFYKTQNGMISLAIIGDPLFAVFCNKVLNCPALAQQYPTNQLRLENIETFENILCPLLLQKTSEEWIALCKPYGIVCTPVNTITQMLQSPFGAHIIDHTLEGTPIIANSGKTSQFGHQPMKDAPLLDAQRNAIEALVNMKGFPFAELRRYIFSEPFKKERNFLKQYPLSQEKAISHPNDEKEIKEITKRLAKL